jgi:hypothetical protein
MTTRQEQASRHERIEGYASTNQGIAKAGRWL